MKIVAHLAHQSSRAHERISKTLILVWLGPFQILLSGIVERAFARIYMYYAVGKFHPDWEILVSRLVQSINWPSVR